LIALHNSNMRAVVGLDGTYGFANGQGADEFKRYYNPSRAAVTAAILDIRRADADIDLDAAQAFQRSDRYFVRMPGMFHGDFTSFVMGAQAFHLSPPQNAAPNWTRAIGVAGYQQVCAGILDFLTARFGADGNAFSDWQAGMKRNGASITHDRPTAR
jgi:hypothetical protein